MRYRLILFIVLSAAIMLGYQYYFMPIPPQPPSPDLGKTLQTESAFEGTMEKPGIAQKNSDEEIPVFPILLQDSGKDIKDFISFSVKPENDRKIEVDTEILKIIFSEKGGYIEEVTLKKFNEKEIPIKLFSDSYYGAVFFSGNSEKKVSSFSFEGPSKITISKDESRELIFKTIDEGMEVEKRFLLKSSDYAFDMFLGLRNGSDVPIGISEQIVLGPHFFLLGAQTDNRYIGHVGPVIDKGGKLTRETFEKLESPKNFSSDIEWTGLESKYFLASIKLPDKDYSAVFSPEGKDKLIVGVQSKLLKMNPLESVSTKYSFYIGPKYYSVLEKKGLEKAVDFGWFGILGKPLLIALNWIYSYLGNYGLSIVIITIILKIIFLPLTQKSFTSMQKMKDIQPQIKSLRDKYKKDPKKMNEETMALYKEYGVNPMGGCLPMLFQVPVFIAFYNVLLNSVELRGAPFFWWMTDLSQKDPYYITPILMGVTMLIQQKMTPTAGDPRQAQIMMIMPVVFTFMFMSFPIGLVIYWTMNNVLTIGQQYFMMPKDKKDSEEPGKKSRSVRRKKSKEREIAKGK